jgi:hypothetical protein
MRNRTNGGLRHLGGDEPQRGGGPSAHPWAAIFPGGTCSIFHYETFCQTVLGAAGRGRRRLGR